MEIDYLIKEINYHSELMEKLIKHEKYIQASDEALILGKLCYAMAIIKNIYND